MLDLEELQNGCLGFLENGLDGLGIHIYVKGRTGPACYSNGRLLLIVCSPIQLRTTA